MSTKELVFVISGIVLVVAITIGLVSYDRSVPLEHHSFMIVGKPYKPPYTTTHWQGKMLVTEHHPEVYSIVFNIEGEVTSRDVTLAEWGSTLIGDTGVCACKHGKWSTHLYLESWLVNRFKRPQEKEQ